MLQGPMKVTSDNLTYTDLTTWLRMTQGVLGKQIADEADKNIKLCDFEPALKWLRVTQGVFGVLLVNAAKAQLVYALGVDEVVSRHHVTRKQAIRFLVRYEGDVEAACERIRGELAHGNLR